MLLALPVAAHKNSDSYLTVEVVADRLTVQWDIALRDLDLELGLDGDENGEITWAEVQARTDAIADYALARLYFSSDGQPCVADSPALQVDTHTDGIYAVLQYSALCSAPVTALDIDYRLFATTDPQHRGLLNLRAGEVTRTAVFDPVAPAQRFAVGQRSRLATARSYIQEGVWHILIGFDHILFLLSLLLPAVAWRTAGLWHAETRLRAAVIDVAKVVTAFTLAHSLTLSAAVLGWVSLPSRWVESAIALSVAVAAGANLSGHWRERRWLVAFGFGLIHGFGFASVLSDLGLPADALMLALVGFNIGVELGQLAIVALFLPLAFIMRRSAFYQRACYQAGSAIIVCIALVWFCERAFLLQLAL